MCASVCRLALLFLRVLPAMAEADDIMAAIQAILEVAQGEFSSVLVEAGGGMGGMPRWGGVDADARLRISRRVRDEVNRLREAFVRVRAAIDAVPGGDMTPAELEAAMCGEQRELERVLTVKAKLEMILKHRPGDTMEEEVQDTSLAVRATR